MKELKAHIKTIGSILLVLIVPYSLGYVTGGNIEINDTVEVVLSHVFYWILGFFIIVFTGTIIFLVNSVYNSIYESFKEEE